LIKGARRKFEYDKMLDRSLLALTYNINRGKQPAITPEKIMPFTTDEKQRQRNHLTELTPQQMKEHKLRLIEKYGLKGKVTLKDD
jgi:hypothetical protein